MNFFDLFLKACTYTTNAAKHFMKALQMYKWFEDEEEQGRQGLGNMRNVLRFAVQLDMQKGQLRSWLRSSSLKASQHL